MIVLQIHIIKHNSNLPWYIILEKVGNLINFSSIDYYLGPSSYFGIIFGAKVATTVQPIFAMEQHDLKTVNSC
jgi:hypothetical protein